MKLSFLTVVAFLSVVLCALLCLYTAADRQSSGPAWIGLWLLAAVAVLFFGWFV